MDSTTHDLVQRVRALLAPGEIDLNGVIVHTPYGSDEEIEMFEATLAVGELIAECAGVDDWYVYSGNDDPAFSSNQHQGLCLADDEFVWECQQLLRDGTFDVVMYYEDSVDQSALVAGVEELGYDVTSVDSSASGRL